MSIRKAESEFSATGTLSTEEDLVPAETNAVQDKRSIPGTPKQLELTIPEPDIVSTTSNQRDVQQSKILWGFQRKHRSQYNIGLSLPRQ